MLPKKKRLSAKKVKEMFLLGKRKHFPEMTVYWQENVYSFPRVNVLVPKKILPKAVWRNRVKRKINQVLGKLIQKQEILPKDYLLVVKSKEFLSEKIDQIENKIKYYFNEILN